MKEIGNELEEKNCVLKNYYKKTCIYIRWLLMKTIWEINAIHVTVLKYKILKIYILGKKLVNYS